MEEANSERILDYSESRECLVQPDFVEYDGTTVSLPGFDLIFVANTLKELGMIIIFWTKEIDIDEIILPMKDITKLSTRANIETAWMAHNSVMIHEPNSTLEAIQTVVNILDASLKRQNSIH